MSTVQPSRAKRRFPLFVQVAVGAWLIVAALAGVMLVPLAAQTALGALVHGGIVLFADRKYMLSAVAAIAVGTAVAGATAGFCIALVDDTWGIYLITGILAELSAVLGWIFVRREVEAAKAATPGSP